MEEYPVRVHRELSDDRINELEQTLHNMNEISVFCDCSVASGSTTVGLAACYVGSGEIFVEACKINTVYANKITYLEFMAVQHALNQLPKIIEKYNDLSYYPKRITIYSDAEDIEGFIYSGIGKKQFMKDISNNIKELMRLLDNEAEVTVKYIAKQKKHNIFYKAAHHGSRKVIGK